MTNLDELIMSDHPMFADDIEPSKYFPDIVQHLAEAGIAYPSFVTWDVPDDVHVIQYDGTRFFTNEDYGPAFDSLAEAYDAIHAAGFDADFSEEALASEEVEKHFGGMVFLKSEEGRNTSRLLVGPVDHLQLEYYHYYSFLYSAKEYLKNPDDVVLAWSFIQNHPAFWYRWDEDRPNLWNKENGHHSVWVWPTYNKDGLVVMMEHGAAVAPHYLNHYHDLRLDVWGKSFEDAYIQLAKKVHKFFNLDGSERKNVKYKKSKLQEDLDEILDRME